MSLFGPALVWLLIISPAPDGSHAVKVWAYDTSESCEMWAARDRVWYPYAEVTCTRTEVQL